MSSLTLSALTSLVSALYAPAEHLAGAFDGDFIGIKYGDNVSSGETVMNLHLLNETTTSGAVCLDGTPGGFYFSAATDPKNRNDWQIYFQGGGWCYDEEDCWGRSNGNLGSSTGWKPTGTLGGLLDSDCTKNPDFCNFNRVWFVYCDGNSFSGNRDDPVPVKGTDGKMKNLYFRGRRIIDESLKALSTKFGLASAENVLLTGCSAGGLATYLHTDYVQTQLKSKWATGMTKYKASSISGFFLQHNNVEGKPVYATQMENIFNLANSTHGVNDACIASLPVDKQWQCNFAQHAYAHTAAPTFPLNSALDSWQTQCIYTSELPPDFPKQTGTENGVCGAAAGWAACSKNPESCNATELVAMNQYITDFDSIMASAGPTHAKAGNGAFIHSCHTHCEAQSNDFFTFKVNGVSMQEAVSKWWNAPVTDPAAKHTYAPCQYKTTSPHKCNPTC